MIADRDFLNNSTILITGATGFIGGLLVDAFISMNTYNNANIKLVLPVRSTKKARDRYPAMDDRYKCITIIETALEDIDSTKLEMPVDYIFHCACVTSSFTMITQPVEVADGIVIGTRNMLKLALKKKIKSMVYLSSMEVYGKIKGDNTLVTEDMLGDIDIYSKRSCYPMAKRMAEHYCYSYYKEYELPVKIARLAQTFGYGVDFEDSRVFAQFAKAAHQGKDIILHTRGLSMGNYCESGDAIDALLTIMDKGQNGEAYNVVNEENTMTIRDMAKLVAEKLTLGKINVTYDIPENNKYGYAADSNIRLSSEKLRKLGWRPTKNLEDMYKDMILYLYGK